LVIWREQQTNACPLILSGVLLRLHWHGENTIAVCRENNRWCLQLK
jgi:hypothetical protein